jgi:hypothetical protein
MEYLSETLNIPFKPLFNEEDIISYLKELDL